MPSQKERFVSNPVSLDISRSKFNLNHKHTTTFNAGQLVPILAYSDVLPGDTFKMDVSFVCRSTTPIAPTMDDAYIQVEFYFVPHKLVLSRAYMAPQTNDSNHSWAAIIGAQDSLLNMPLPDPDYNLPGLQWNTNADEAEYRKSVAHYLGYPSPGVNNDPSDYSGIWDGYFNPLPMLAFYAVWNENYRDPNLMPPVVFSITGSGVIQFATNKYAGISVGGASDNIFKHLLPVVCREHGYFGSALPWPQRNGTTVNLPLGELAPVVPKGTVTKDGDALLFKIDGTPTTTAAQDLVLNTTAGNPAGSVASEIGSSSSPLANLIKGTNLFADLSEATAASVNMLRYAIQLQRLYEAWARGGNRIQDLTQIFGVTPHDMGDDRPEYLGGKRIPLNITQVNNTSGTTYSTATQQSIGSTGAFSNTSDVDHYFTKSFDTWGTIIGVCLVRHHDSFGMMFPKMLSRRNRLDFYWPQFANLGEQPVYVREMCFSDLHSSDNFLNSGLDFDEVFGYQEAYAEYRYIPDRISGEVDFTAKGPLGYWVYNSDCGFGGDIMRPLGAFIDASLQADDIDATLQVDHLTAGFQYLAQFYFDITAVRPMPLYSIPGLMDHH